MANPNLVRKISDSPSGSSGEISPASVISTSNLSKNYIINGDMRISQRNSSYTAVANAQYTLDRWVYFKVGAMVHTVTQDTDVPSFAQSGQLFQNSLRLNLTTPDTSIAAGDYAHIQQKIEGYNWAQIAQKDFTLSFWVKASLPGTYCVNFRNGVDVAYIAEYVIESPATWEYKTISISASPSTGTWNYTNGIGIALTFVLAGGSNFYAAPEVWHTANSLFNTSNQINGVNTGATDFRITGVMLNEGRVAAPFKLFGESFNEELQACQRYYQKSGMHPTTPWIPGISANSEIDFRTAVRNIISTDRASLHEPFKVVMRNIPTVVLYPGRNTVANTADRVSAYNTDTIVTYVSSGLSFGPSGLSGFLQTMSASHELYTYQYTADAEL